MKVDINEVKALYEGTDNVWPENDLWHQYSKKQIEKYISEIEYTEDSFLLNAGSGGSNYGLSNRMMHVDVAENKIRQFPEYVVSTIEAMPFSDNVFSDIICVGSVLNYCDASAAIHELARVLKEKGSLVLEFESSWGYEHRKSAAYKCVADVVSLPYYGDMHSQWIYAPDYIRSIITAEKMMINDEYRFHFLSGLSFSMHHVENRAAYYTKFDKLCRYIPIINKHSNNVIFKCMKL